MHARPRLAGASGVERIPRRVAGPAAAGHGDHDLPAAVPLSSAASITYNRSSCRWGIRLVRRSGCDGGAPRHPAVVPRRKRRRTMPAEVAIVNRTSEARGIQNAVQDTPASRADSTEYAIDDAVYEISDAAAAPRMP